MNDEQLVRRIKVHTLIGVIAAAIATGSAMLEYFVLIPLGVMTTESAGIGMFLFTQLPLAVIAIVMGFVAFFYGRRNTTWRGLRIVVLLVSAMMIVVFVLPIGLGVLLHR